jgi:hypothetical protein
MGEVPSGAQGAAGTNRESVGARAGKLISKAFARAEARLLITRPGQQPSFDELLAEVTVQLRAMVASRTEKDHRKIRKAARRIHEGHGLVELIEALGPPPGPRPGPDAVSGAAAADPPWSGTDLPEKRQPPEWNGPPGVPRWHPEHRLNEEA